MNLDFDLESRLAALLGNREGGQLDWHGLRARLAAAYAARAELGREMPYALPVESGSFDSGSARALAVYGLGAGGLCPVNPTGLANCNSECDKDAAAASAIVAGDRG